MNEKFSDERTSAYLDNELPLAERIAFERELAEDPSLRQAVEELRALHGSMGALPRHKLEGDFASRILQLAEQQIIAPERGQIIAPERGAAGGAASPIASKLIAPVAEEKGVAPTPASHGNRSSGGSSGFQFRNLLWAATAASVAVVLTNFYHANNSFNDRVAVAPNEAPKAGERGESSTDAKSQQKVETAPSKQGDDGKAIAAPPAMPGGKSHTESKDGDGSRPIGKQSDVAAEGPSDRVSMLGDTKDAHDLQRKDAPSNDGEKNGSIGKGAAFAGATNQPDQRGQERTRPEDTVFGAADALAAGAIDESTTVIVLDVAPEAFERGAFDRLLAENRFELSNKTADAAKLAATGAEAKLEENLGDSARSGIAGFDGAAGRSRGAPPVTKSVKTKASPEGETRETVQGANSAGDRTLVAGGSAGAKAGAVKEQTAKQAPSSSSADVVAIETTPEQLETLLAAVSSRSQEFSQVQRYAVDKPAMYGGPYGGGFGGVPSGNVPSGNGGGPGNSHPPKETTLADATDEPAAATVEHESTHDAPFRRAETRSGAPDAHRVASRGGSNGKGPGTRGETQRRSFGGKPGIGHVGPTLVPPARGIDDGHDHATKKSSETKDKAPPTDNAAPNDKAAASPERPETAEGKRPEHAADPRPLEDRPRDERKANDKQDVVPPRPDADRPEAAPAVPRAAVEQPADYAPSVKSPDVEKPAVAQRSATRPETMKVEDKPGASPAPKAFKPDGPPRKGEAEKHVAKGMIPPADRPAPSLDNVAPDALPAEGAAADVSPDPATPPAGYAKRLQPLPPIAPPQAQEELAPPTGEDRKLAAASQPKTFLRPADAQVVPPPKNVILPDAELTEATLQADSASAAPAAAVPRDVANDPAPSAEKQPGPSDGAPGDGPVPPAPGAMRRHRADAEQQPPASRAMPKAIAQAAPAPAAPGADLTERAADKADDAHLRSGAHGDVQSSVEGAGGALGGDGFNLARSQRIRVLFILRPSANAAAARDVAGQPATGKATGNANDAKASAAENAAESDSQSGKAFAPSPTPPAPASAPPQP